MTLKYEDGSQQHPVNSPLYGSGYVPYRKIEKEVIPPMGMLHEPETIEAMKYAERIYYKELVKTGYSPLTVGSYSSAVGRFIQFLSCGEVIPDREQ